MIGSSNYLNGRGGLHFIFCPYDGIYFLSDKGRNALVIPQNMDTVLDRVIQSIYEGDKTVQEQDRAIIQEQYGQLRHAVQNGFGNLSFQLEYGTPNYELAANLQYNVGLFSAFKTHDLMHELVALLKDQSGNLKGFSQFRKDALAMIGPYRESWLQVEYNTGVRTCRMASQWLKFQAAKSLYPNLKFTLSRSAHRREDHEVLVGTILPIDHPFWNTHMPPLGWECKCGVTNTDEHPTEVPGSIDVPVMFAFNPGKDGKVFNVDVHPYAQVTKREYQQVATAAWGALCSYERKNALQAAKIEGRFKKGYPATGISSPVRLNRATYESNLGFDAYFFPKLSILNDIEKVLEDSVVIMTENKIRKQHVKHYHVLQHTTSLGKKINLRIEERITGEMYLHHIHIQQ